MITNPPVELSADPLVVLVLGALPAWANSLCVFGPEPVLEEVHVFVITDALEELHVSFPRGVDLSLIGLETDVGEHVPLQHLGETQGQSTIVHRLEDRVGIFI